MIKKKSVISLLLISTSIFSLYENASLASATSVALAPKAGLFTIPYRTSFVLFSQYYKEVPIYRGDKPNPRNCIKHFTIPYICPPGYSITVSASLSASGGADGTKTRNSVQGFGLKYLDINSNLKDGKSTIGYCAYTFYARGQGNAHRAWLSYTVYCNGSGAANSTQA